MDKKFVSNWYLDQSVPESYVQPVEKRPGELHAPLRKALPMVDLGSGDRLSIIQEIMKACDEYGLFQVINHKVPKDLMDDAIRVSEEFHTMPVKDKVEECAKAANNGFSIYTSSENCEIEEVHCWRDTTKHRCHPLDQYIHLWPEKPSGYREVVGAYATELRKLNLELLGLISEGLGLNPSYFSGALSADPEIHVHHYPPCPDPSVTLGLVRHRDPSLITILLQGNVKGLEVLKDNEWIGVDPVPHAFVVNVGYILQIISNGKLMGVEHRAVTNSKYRRTSVAYHVYPSDEAVVEPAQELIDLKNPPLFKPLTFKEFYKAFRAKASTVQVMDDFVSRENA